MKILLFLTLLKLTLSYYISDSPCIERPILQNFDMEKFSGDWYTISRYKNFYERGDLCGHGRNVFINETTSKSTGCQKIDGTLVCMDGIYYIADPDRVPLEGRFKLVLLQNSTQPLDEDFKALSTDYDNYIMMYACKNIESGKSKNLLWVVSRKQSLDESVQPIVDDLIDKYFIRKELIPVDYDPKFCEP